MAPSENRFIHDRYQNAGTVLTSIMARETYIHFAPAYDTILKHVDYHAWYTYLRSIMERYIDDPRTVLELGCGTGKFGAKFSADNFLIYGIDNSIDMLRVAKARAFKNFSIICADMMRFSLSIKIDFIFSVHDTINYFLDYGSLQKVFQSVKNTMHSRSIFMFDITTEHNIYSHFHNKTASYTIKNTSVQWSNTYDDRKRLVHSLLTFTGEDGSTHTENHVQRIYSVDEMQKILAAEGFEILDIFSDYTFKPAGEKTSMINFITRKKQ